LTTIDGLDIDELPQARDYWNDEGRMSETYYQSYHFNVEPALEENDNAAHINAMEQNAPMNISTLWRRNGGARSNPHTKMMLYFRK
jgi:hypothetical protein